MGTGSSQRIYEPNSAKHKWPKGFGNLCPSGMDRAEAQQLLDEAVSISDENGKALVTVRGDWCFVARPTRLEENIWHGYPVVGSEVGYAVLLKLQKAELITRSQLRQLRGQRKLPDVWP